MRKIGPLALLALLVLLVILNIADANRGRSWAVREQPMSRDAVIRREWQAIRRDVTLLRTQLDRLPSGRAFRNRKEGE